MAIVRVPLQVEEDLRDALKAYAKANSMTTNALANDLLYEALRKRLQECRAEYASDLDCMDARHEIWRKASEITPENMTIEHLVPESKARKWFLGDLELWNEHDIEALCFENDEEEVKEEIEALRKRDFIPFAYIEEDYNNAVSYLQTTRAELKALEEVEAILNRNERISIEDENMMITPEGLEWIQHACQREGLKLKEIGDKFLYKYPDAWLDRAYGREPLSKRALNKLRAWLEEVESKHQ